MGTTTATRPTKSLELVASDEELRERFSQLRFPADVGRLLEVPYKTLIYHIYRTPIDRRYLTFQIPKSSGGVRTIRAPATPLKIIQAKLNQVLQAVYRPRDCAHGFVRDRSVRTNADRHRGKRLVLNIDLEDFFPTITFPRVRGIFMAWPYELPDKVATILAQICCCDGRLPQGAPTSPVVSNLICSKMDTQLMRLAEAHRCVYTRYADDITFSTSLRTFPHAIAHPTVTGSVEIGRALATVLESNWFRINERKTRLQARLGRQEVTGLTVNEFPNVQRRYVRQIRAMLHAWERYGYDDAEREFQDKYDLRKHRAPTREPPKFRRVVEGKLEYLAMIKGRSDRTYSGLVRRARRLDSSFNRMPIAGDAVWVIECRPPDIMDVDRAFQGTGFWLQDVGFVSCAHVLSEHSHIFRTESSEQAYRVAELRVSRTHDVAVLSTAAKATYALPIGDPQRLRDGDEVFVLGFPRWSLGQSLHATPADVVGFKALNGVRRISISSRIIKGNSGGPVVDRFGRVVGIAVTGSDADQPEFENGVVPIDIVPRLLSLPDGREEDEDAFS